MVVSKIQLEDCRSSPSALGDPWISIYGINVDFEVDHFENAMLNLIENPNINSTVIIRADILSDTIEPVSGEFVDIDQKIMPVSHNLEDTAPKLASFNSRSLKRAIVRRIIPRNAIRDPVINQSCLLYSEENDLLVIYTPHIDGRDQCPYYLPTVKSIGILYKDKALSLHYVLYDDDCTKFGKWEESHRNLRIATRLLQTAYKHSLGVMNGYKKRVHHDLTVKKVAFQDRYIQLKQKYAKSSVANWVECTDPRKHVFEDLAIAAFLIELWSQMYKSKNEFKFLDLGCGNGLLVHLLLSEGYDGEGIDARARKSWQVYPVHVREKLREQVIIPKVLIDQLDPSQPIVDNLTKDQLLAEGSINMVTPSPNTFIIGNHSDELTVWIPLFGYPFMVIPCCSYDIAGAKARYPQRRPESTSTYASLVDHVEFIAKKVGWNLESERLRIPSTRNAALIGRSRDENVDLDIKSVIESEGKADGWIERSLALRSQAPRSH